MPLPKCYKYNLKMKYKRYMLISLAFSLLLLSAAFKFFPDLDNSEDLTVYTQELLTVENVIATKHEKPKVPEPPKMPDIKLAEDTEDIIEDITFINNELNDNIPDSAPDLPPPAKKDDDNEGEFVPFLPVEDQPKPIGGIAGIMKKITYPEFARRAGVEGKVTVIAFINENGDVYNLELAKGIGAGCDEEAIEAVQATKFSPGKQRGKPVKTKVFIPIVFKLH